MYISHCYHFVVSSLVSMSNRLGKFVIHIFDPFRVRYRRMPKNDFLSQIISSDWDKIQRTLASRSFTYKLKELMLDLLT
jgi:hypothetical protein